MNEHYQAGTYHTSGYNPHGDLWRAWQAALAQQPGGSDNGSV